MSWNITLEIANCTAPATKLAGVEVIDGITNVTALTDAAGRVSYTKEDTLATFLVKANLTGFIGRNFTLHRTNSGTVQQECLQPVPEGVNPEDLDEATGHGGDTGGGCFIVTAATGSPQSPEVAGLRTLRDRVAAASKVAADLIRQVYDEYAVFSPAIAQRIEASEAGRAAVRSIVVRPLVAWYSLAEKLAFEPANQDMIREALKELAHACKAPFGAAQIADALTALCSEAELPWAAKRFLGESLPVVEAAGRLKIVAWAMLDPLCRAWNSSARGLDPVEQVAEWLAAAPLERIAPPSDAPELIVEIKVLAKFLEFSDRGRRQLGRRLSSSWPGAAHAVKLCGLA